MQQQMPIHSQFYWDSKVGLFLHFLLLGKSDNCGFDWQMESQYDGFNVPVVVESQSWRTKKSFNSQSNLNIIDLNLWYDFDMAV